MTRSPSPVVAASLAVLAGCAGAPSERISVHVPRPAEQAMRPYVALPKAPIVVRPMETECRPFDPTAEKREVRASFGFQARACLGLPPDFQKSALVIVSIDPVGGRSPAAEAGLRVGDRVLTINGCAISELQLLAKQGTYTPGNAVEVSIARYDGGRRHTPLLTLVRTDAVGRNSTLPAATCEAIGLRSARGG